jgi:hypothetical protein
MKRIDGQPVGNAMRRVRVNVTAADIKNGKPLNPNACAIAVACQRQVQGCTAAKVHLGVVYLMIGGHWRRWLTPAYARTEIVAFDRGGKFVPQEIDLIPPPIKPLPRYRKQASGGSKRGGFGRTRRRVIHRVQDVRDSAHANDGAK